MRFIHIICNVRIRKSRDYEVHMTPQGQGLVKLFPTNSTNIWKQENQMLCKPV